MFGAQLLERSTLIAIVFFHSMEHLDCESPPFFHLKLYVMEI